MNDRSTFLGARDSTSGVAYTAPYAFIPLVEPLPSPFGDAVPSHSRPLEDGACGSIDVEWVFERPVLVGASKPEDGWAVFAKNSRNVPVLPGGTTRGLIRALLEIATGSRMDHYDHDAHFAVRDLEDEDVWQKAMPTTTGRALSFGWLRPAIAGKRPNAHSFDGWVIELVERAYQLETSTLVPDVETFETNTVSEKMAELENCGRFHIGARIVRKDAPGNKEEPYKAVFDPRGDVSGWVVVTGVDPVRMNPTSSAGDKAPKPKKYATLFVDQPGSRVFPVPEEVMRRFVKTHNTTPGGEDTCAWDYWFDRMKEGMPRTAGGAVMPGIPVFIGHKIDGAPSSNRNTPQPNPRENQGFRNDRLAALLKQLEKQLEGQAGQRKAAEEATLVYLSLSRFVKIPHARSLRSVIESQKHVLDMRLDFARALFGQVPPEKIDPKIEEKPGRGALKGRVFFGEAELTAPERVPDPLPKIGATMAPRASFWPYYLSPGGAGGGNYDYSNPTARIAGWKRYPVRPTAIAFQRDDRANDGGAVPNVPRRTEAGMRFLPASKDRPLTFRGRIHLHNVKPEEIGALIWSLTWGGVTSGERQPQRHQIGRGKPQGYGVCHCRVTGLDLETNLGAPAKSAAQYVSDFRTFVLDAWNASGNGPSESDFDSLPMVAPLLAMADPAIAEGLENRLVYPSLRTSRMSADSSPLIEGYKAIKKAAEFHSGRSLLPPYPRSR